MKINVEKGIQKLYLDLNHQENQNHWFCNHQHKQKNLFRLHCCGISIWFQNPLFPLLKLFLLSTNCGNFTWLKWMILVITGEYCLDVFTPASHPALNISANYTLLCRHKTQLSLHLPKPAQCLNFNFNGDFSKPSPSQYINAVGGRGAV